MCFYMIGGGVVGGLADDPIRQQRRRNRQRQNCLSWRKIVVVVYGWLTSSSSSPLLIFLCIETTTTNHPNNNNNNKMWRPFSSNSVRALQVIPSLASTTRRRQSLLRYPTLPCTKRTKTIPKHYNTWDFSIYPTYLVVANAATEASKNNGDADSKGDFLMQRQSLLLQDLNTNQVSAVTQPLDQITRVVAGPGSGKTRVLTSRIAWLLLHEPHSRILAVTFTRKAADEMKQRVQKLVSDTTTTTTATATLDRVTLGTFHSIAAKILRWHGSSLASLPLIQQDMEKSDEPINLDGNFNIADQNEQLRVLKDVLKECNIDLQSLSPQGKEVKPLIILQAINRCKVLFSRGVNAFQNIDKDGTWITILASQLYYPYREKMLSANCIDFDDLILLTRQLLMVDENVKQRLQTYWPHVLVDEFQDTSESQVDLVKLLTRNSLFIVGDADQSIYSWRGAHASSLTDFENHFRDMHENGVSTVYLMENYRSTSSIVKAAQMVIASSDKSSGAHQLRQNMIPKRESGTPPRVISFSNAQTEAEFVVMTVQDGVATGVYGPNHSVAFIYRTNAQSRALEEACVLYNLPYIIFGSAASFYQRQEVKDCLCFLRFLYNGRDRSAMLRAMTTPKRGIADAAIREFDDYCSAVEEHWNNQSPRTPAPNPLEVLFHLSGDDEWTVYQGIQFPSAPEYLSKRALNLFQSFSKQMLTVRRVAARASVETVLQTIIDEMGLIDHLSKISKSTTESEERQANVRELQLASMKYSDKGPCLPKQLEPENDAAFVQSPLGIFLDDVALVTDMAKKSESTTTEKRLVASLMTIHASKGMEFDTVFIVGMEEGTIPTQKALMAGEGSVALEEEKRLCYVAMTRAKSELIMTWRHEVPIFTAHGMSSKEAYQSQFLDVLDPSVSALEKQLRSLTTPDDPKNRSKFSNSKTKKKKKTPQSPYATRNFGTVAAQNPLLFSSRPAQRFSGTSSVYANTRSSVLGNSRNIEKTSPIREQSIRPLQPKQPSRSPPPRRIRMTPDTEFPVERSTHHSPKNGRKNDIEGSLHQQLQQPQRFLPPESSSDSKTSMDAHWFFPVGSQVQHAKWGKGIVLPSSGSSSRQEQPEEKDKKMHVRVQFSNGVQHEFPVHGSDIIPIL